MNDTRIAKDTHQWSGWPGAFCLRCGIEDAAELCLAEHETLITCVQGHLMCQEGHQLQTCSEHQNPPCAPNRPSLTPRDLTLILAGLRMFQNHLHFKNPIEAANMNRLVLEEILYPAGEEPPTEHELDLLCDLLNTERHQP